MRGTSVSGRCYLVEVGLTGEGRRGWAPALLTCPRVPSSLRGRKEGHQQGMQPGSEPQPQQSSWPSGDAAAVLGAGGGAGRCQGASLGASGQHSQGQQPESPWLGPRSSGHHHCGPCSSPHRALQTCWACKHPQPGCTSGHHLGGDAEWPGRLPSWPCSAAVQAPGPWPAGGRSWELCTWVLLPTRPPTRVWGQGPGHRRALCWGIVLGEACLPQIHVPEISEWTLVAGRVFADGIS